MTMDDAPEEQVADITMQCPSASCACDEGSMMGKDVKKKIKGKLKQLKKTVLKQLKTEKTDDHKNLLKKMRSEMKAASKVLKGKCLTMADITELLVDMKEAILEANEE